MKIDIPKSKTCGDDNLMELSMTKEANLASADVLLMTIISILSIASVDMVCWEKKTYYTMSSTSLGFTVMFFVASLVLRDWHNRRGQSMGANPTSKSVLKLNHFSSTVDVTLVLIIGIQLHISVLFFRIFPMEPSKSYKFIFIVLLFICSVICQISAVIMQYRLYRRYSHSIRNMNDYTTVKAKFLPSPWWYVLALYGFQIIFVVNERLQVRDYRISFISIAFAVMADVASKCSAHFIYPYNDTHCEKVKPASRSDEYLQTVFTYSLFLASIGFQFILTFNQRWGSKDSTIHLICIIFAGILDFVVIVQRALLGRIPETSNSTNQGDKTSLNGAGV